MRARTAQPRRKHKQKAATPVKRDGLIARAVAAPMWGALGTAHSAVATELFTDY
jgi:hypothetical protein